MFNFNLHSGILENEYIIKVPSKVEVRPSKRHGMGVFATERILEGEVIEECHLIPVQRVSDPNKYFMADYKFDNPVKGTTKEYVLPLGYGAVYNHDDNNNAGWRNHLDSSRNTFEFFAIRDIEPGEEICTKYGTNHYWETVNKAKNKLI